MLEVWNLNQHALANVFLHPSESGELTWNLRLAESKLALLIPDGKDLVFQSHRLQIRFISVGRWLPINVAALWMLSKVIYIYIRKKSSVNKCLKRTQNKQTVHPSHTQIVVNKSLNYSASSLQASELRTQGDRDRSCDEATRCRRSHLVGPRTQQEDGGEKEVLAHGVAPEDSLQFTPKNRVNW